MDTPTTPVHNAKGGMLFVEVDKKSGEHLHPPIHEDDLTAAQRAQYGLPPLPESAPPPVQDSPQATEEVGPDV